MDDYSLSSLTESKNELCARLVNVLTPLIISGFKDIFDESLKICMDNDEEDKYLMTFQNFISRIPNWTNAIVEKERERIIDKSGCGYLEDLITCVHIIHLKAITCVRVGQQQKKVDIDVPSLDKFLHNTYINCARKIYTNVYLFERNIMPLQTQKHNREIELLVKECIMNTIRESVPIENILRTYIDETEEKDVQVEEHEEVVPIEVEKEVDVVEEQPVTVKNDTVVGENTQKVQNTGMVPTENITMDVNELNMENNKPNIKFNNTDQAFNSDGVMSNVDAPKTIDRLEQISMDNNMKRKLEEEDDYDSDEEALDIGDDIDLGEMDVLNISNEIKLNKSPLLTDVEILS